MKTFIVDDERLSIVTLQNMIYKFCPELEIVGTASSIKEAAVSIPEYMPQLLFLDIQLKDGLIFKLLEQLRKVMSLEHFKFVFVTAYNKYALKAFEWAAIHYLLKPISPKDLRDVMQRLPLVESNNDMVQHQLSIMEDAFGHSPKQIAIPNQKSIDFVELKDILYCAASDNYTVFYLQNGAQYLSSKSLSFYENLLDDNTFIRIHSKYLIHGVAIKKYIRGRGGEVVLVNDETLPVSVRKKSILLKYLADKSGL